MPAAPTQFSVQEILNRCFLATAGWNHLNTEATGGGFPVSERTVQAIFNLCFDPARNAIAL